MRILLTVALALAGLSACAQNRIWPIKGSVRIYENMRLEGLNTGEGKVLMDTTGTGWVNFWAPADSLYATTSGDTTTIIYRPFVYGYDGSTEQDTITIIAGSGSGTLTTARNGLSVAGDTAVILGGNLTQNTTIRNRGYDLINQIDNQWAWKSDSNLLGAGRGGWQVSWSDGTTTLGAGAAEFSGSVVRVLSRFTRTGGDTLQTDLRSDWRYTAGFRSPTRQNSLLIDSFDLEMRYTDRTDDSAAVITVGRANVTLPGQSATIKNHIRLSVGSQADTTDAEIFVFSDSVLMVTNPGPSGGDDFIVNLNARGFWSVSGGNLEYRQLEDSVYFLGIRAVAADTASFKPAVFNPATDEFVAMSSWPEFSQLSGDSLYGVQTDSTIQIILKVGAARRDTISISTDPAFSVLSVGVDTVYCQLYSFAPVNLSAGAAVVLPPNGPFQPGDWFGVSDIYANAAANNAIVQFPSGSQKLYNASVNDTINVDGTTRTYIFMDNTTEWVIQD